MVKNVQINKGRMKDKNNVIISMHALKTFDKIQLPFLIKFLNKLAVEGSCLNLRKDRYGNRGKLEAVPGRSGTRPECLLSLLLFNTLPKDLTSAIREVKEIKYMQMEGRKSNYPCLQLI
jgi:hypothetical protein